MNRASEIEPDPALGQFVGDVSGIAKRMRQPVQLGDNESVTASAGSERFSLRPGRSRLRPSEAMIYMSAW